MLCSLYRLGYPEDIYIYIYMHANRVALNLDVFTQSSYFVG